LLLLSAGLLFISMLQMTTILARNPVSSSKERVAVDLAQAAIDRLQQLPWRSIQSSQAEGFDLNRGGIVPAFARLPAAAGDSVTFQGTVYYRLWHVTGDSDLPNLKTVTVLCCWRVGQNRWQHTVLVTQVADVGR
jgi:hypothetical protein